MDARFTRIEEIVVNRTGTSISLIDLLRTLRLVQIPTLGGGDVSEPVFTIAAVGDFDAEITEDLEITPFSGATGVLGVTVSETTLTVDENAGEATYTVVLDAEPGSQHTVTVTPDISAPATVAVMPERLRFTAANWNTPLTVTVTGKDDDDDNPHDRPDVTIAHDISDDPPPGQDNPTGGYDTVSVASIAVKVRDDEDPPPGITAIPTELEVEENGGTATYTLVLDAPPSETNMNVTLTPSVRAVDLSKEALDAPAAVTFTREDWNKAQTLTVTGRNNDIEDPGGKRTVIVTHLLTTTGTYGDGNVVTPRITVDVLDDDKPGDPGVTIAPTALEVAENGGTATYTLVLGAPPSETNQHVILSPAVAQGSPADAVTLPDPVTFTRSNWNEKQTLTVTGVDNDIEDPGGQRTVVINHSLGTEAGRYGDGSVTLPVVTVTVTDDGNDGGGTGPDPDPDPDPGPSPGPGGGGDVGQVTGVTVAPGPDGLVVSWVSALRAERYKVQWKSGEQDWDEATRQLVTTGLTVTIPDLEPGTEYTVRVIGARSDGADGPPSGEIMVPDVTNVPALPLLGQLLLALLLLAGGARLHRRRQG